MLKLLASQTKGSDLGFYFKTTLLLASLQFSPFMCNFSWSQTTPEKVVAAFFRFHSKCVENQKIDLVAANRFIGFLEGATGQPVPSGWEESLVEGGVDENRINFKGGNNFATKDLTVFVTNQFDVTAVDQEPLLIKCGEGSFAFGIYNKEKNTVAIDNKDFSCNRLAVGVVGDDLLVASVSSYKTFIDVVLISDKGAQKWRTRITRKSDSALYSGVVDTACYIVDTDFGIVIYGVQKGIGFVDCLNKGNGSIFFQLDSRGK